MRTRKDVVQTRRIRWPRNQHRRVYARTLVCLLVLLRNHKGGRSVIYSKWCSWPRNKRKIKHTICDGIHKTVDRHSTIEKHPGRQSLLSHEIAGKKTVHIQINCKTVGPYLNTRASEVKPAIAIPTWSSIRNIFCWYDASSPVDRYIHINDSLIHSNPSIITNLESQ